MALTQADAIVQRYLGDGNQSQAHLGNVDAHVPTHDVMYNANVPTHEGGGLVLDQRHIRSLPKLV